MSLPTELCPTSSGEVINDPAQGRIVPNARFAKSSNAEIASKSVADVNLSDAPMHRNDNVLLEKKK